MLKKTITYTDYNGVERKEDFYFNLSKAEILEMEMTTAGGFAEMLKKVAESNDGKQITQVFKDIIFKAYGEKTPDGKRFMKVKDGVRLVEAFAETEAYANLFTELATDAEAASAFVNGIIPENI